jgi:hypothetical protein
VPTLEAAFLLEHGLSILSPCERADIMVENDEDGHVIQLQPKLAVRANQRRKLNNR